MDVKEALFEWADSLGAVFRQGLAHYLVRAPIGASQ
jgi:hypothetical protein